MIIATQQAVTYLVQPVRSLHIAVAQGDAIMSLVIHRSVMNFLVCMITLLSASTPALAMEFEEESAILVARPELGQDAMYGSTIVVTKPMPDGSSLGFIINKPTPVTLGQLFPKHAPSLKVPGPIFLGGPIGTDLIFALVQRHDSPGAGSIQIAPDLFLAIQSDAVDRIIESESDHARFFAGMVVWRPGELDDELKRGLWYEMEPDSRLVLRKKTEGLWEELLHRSEMDANSI